MTLPASGAISMSQINTELGSNRNDLNDSWVRQLAGVNTTNTTISFSNLYSKTGRFDGNIQMSAAIQSIGFSPTLFGASANELIRNAGNGNAELDFNSAPNWTGSFLLTNHTTGISSTLAKQNAQSWQGSNPANLLRASQTDNFTIQPA